MEAPKQRGREALIDAILAFLADQDLLALRDIRAALEREVDAAGAESLLALRTRLADDHGWGYYPSDPLARRIHHLLATSRRWHTLRSIELLLHAAGCDELATRLTALAGPKVFSSRARRFSSLCFGTVKVPQSAEVSSGEAVLSARQVAVAARQSIDVAIGRLRGGDALVLFGEGTRSRTGEMQAMLAGVARYLDIPEAWVLPVGLAGSEALFPVDTTAPRPARVVAQLGRPFKARMLLDRAAGDRRLVMDAIGLAIAAAVLPKYRGVYGDASRYPDAQRVLQESRE
jgi:hypothetical protein